MAEQRVQRRLAAILAADVVGYSRLMRDDEEGTLARLKALRGELLDPKAAEYGGRVVKTTGDGSLIEFPSAVDAIQFAVDVQHAMARRAAGEPDNRRIALRMGINLGDVIVDGDDIYGDGVNVAARLEGLARPGGVCVSLLIRESVRHKLDVAFVDMGEQSVKNIADPVHVFGIDVSRSGSGTESASPADALFRRPAVAVLPFENLSGDAEQDYFADGLTEDIITALSHWRSFPVIARNSTFAYKGTSPDIRKVGEELGARYVVEGSVRKAGSRVRITAQLINAETGHHVWAEKYDRELEDIFALQDEMTHRIAAIIEPAITGAEQKQLSTKPPKDLNAWDLCIQGYSRIYEGTEEGNRQARGMFERACAIDPGYARAWIGLAYTYNRAIRLRFTDDRASAAEKALEAARRAVALDETDSDARLMLGRAIGLSGQWESATAEMSRAIELNPQNSVANWSLGHMLYVSGRAEEAISWIEKALDINPLDPRNYVVKAHLAVAKLCVEEYEAAAEMARASAGQRPDYLEARLTLATALGYLGRVDEARQAIGEFREEAKGYVEDHPVWGQDLKDCFLAGLKKAHIVE